MSWSYRGVGRPKPLAEAAAASLAAVKCAEPEETIKAKVAEIIGTCLAAFPDDGAVEIEAHGSQSTDSSKPGVAVNSLTVNIKPLYGFVG
jgi:hypothetical protein